MMGAHSRTLQLALASLLALACVPDPAPELGTTGATADTGATAETKAGTSSETGEDIEPAPACVDETLGCIFESNSESSELSCELACELIVPCPISSITAYGHSVDTSSPTCVLEALQSTQGPKHFRYGIAEEDGSTHQYWTTVQWDLWIVEDDQAVLRRVARWTDLLGGGPNASVMGGVLPQPDAFGVCLDPGMSWQDQWDCVIEQIQWCGPTPNIGPTGEQPWCPS